MMLTVTIILNKDGMVHAKLYAFFYFYIYIMSIDQLNLFALGSRIISF
jgi:hypothetical protein